MFGRLGALGSLGALGGGGRRTAVDDLSVTISARASVSATSKAAYLASVSVGAVSAVTVETGVEVNVSAVAAVEALTRAGYRVSAGVSNIAGVTAAGIAGRTASVAVSNIAGVSIEAGSSIDADAQAVIDAMTSTPTSGRQSLIEGLVTGLKSDGIWSKLDRLWVMAAHDAQAARLDWKNPATSANALTAVNSPTFTTDQGFTGNGSSAYLDTNFNPSSDGSNYALNTATAAVWVRAAAPGSAIYIGGRDGFNHRVDIQRPSLTSGKINTGGINSQNTTLEGTSSATSTGLFAANRSAINARQLYVNGVAEASDALASSARPAVSMYLLGFNNQGSPLPYNTQASVGVFGASLTATEHSNLYSRLNTYMTGL